MTNKKQEKVDLPSSEATVTTRAELKQVEERLAIGANVSTMRRWLEGRRSTRKPKFRGRPADSFLRRLPSGRPWHQNAMTFNVKSETRLPVPNRAPAQPMPAPIKEPPSPLENPDAPVREPDPEDPDQI
ncbi:MAG: hypothetical protein WCA20_15525 [Candidatus Sulfotelmatobacter sp.]